MRLVLLISMLTAALQAGSITVVQTSSGFGNTSSFYSYNVPNSVGGASASVYSGADCVYGSPPCSTTDGAIDTIELTLNLDTAGPARNGIAYISLIFDSGGSLGGGVHQSGSIGPYSVAFCPMGIACYLTGYYPFQLGVPFTIDLNAVTSAYGPYGLRAGVSTEILASLQLYELPPVGGGPFGAPVQIYLIPEPGAAILAITGLSALMLFGVVRKRKLFPLFGSG